MVFFLLSLFFGWASAAEEPPVLVVRAANGYTVPYDSSTEEASGCVVSVDKPTPVKILAETETHFKVEWIKPIRGCLWQTTFYGLDLKSGFVKKDTLLWSKPDEEASPKIVGTTTDTDAHLPLARCYDDIASAMEAADQAEEPADPKVITSYADPNNAGLSSSLGAFDSILDHVRWQGSRIKNPQQIDRYMACYPYGKNGLENYKKYSKYIDLASEVIKLQWGDGPADVYAVNPALMRCKLRRESGFSPEERSGTGAVGLGQHVGQNIEHISDRINTEGSWEQKVWRNFFARVRETREGRRMLGECLGNAKSIERPVFSNKRDAACPLQSIAASAIYNLMVQRSLVKSSGEDQIQRENELDFQLAVAAGYNMGDGASGLAVKDKLVGRWIKAILRKSKDSKIEGKEAEVKNHIESIRNCLEFDNWDPMFSRDRPQCDQVGM